LLDRIIVPERYEVVRAKSDGLDKGMGELSSADGCVTMPPPERGGASRDAVSCHCLPYYCLLYGSPGSVPLSFLDIDKLGGVPKT